MIKYKIQIGDSVSELEHEITDTGLQALCKAHNATYVGTRTTQYYQGFRKVKEITYILKK